MECVCGSNKIENWDLMLCGTCNRLNRKRDAPEKEQKPIANLSKKREKQERNYSKKKRKWLIGKTCQGKFPHNCTIKYDLTCHHMQGRVGYADEWARENDVPLLLDERFWMPLCLEAHKYIEEHPKFAWENQYSFKRITDPIFVKS